MVPTIRQSLNHITNIAPLHQIKKTKEGTENLKHFDTQNEESTVHQRL